MQEQQAITKALAEDSSFGDVSSIMIMPDQIYNNNFNLLDDEEGEAEEIDAEVALGKKSTVTSS